LHVLTLAVGVGWVIKRVAKAINLLSKIHWGLSQKAAMSAVRNRPDYLMIVSTAVQCLRSSMSHLKVRPDAEPNHNNHNSQIEEIKARNSLEQLGVVDNGSWLCRMMERSVPILSSLWFGSGTVLVEFSMRRCMITWLPFCRTREKP
jgi:hypothetical protein